jgi:putative transposase
MRSRNRKQFNLPGAVYFVTTSVVGKIAIFHIPPLRQILIDNLIFYQNHGDFELIAYVIMPSHIHLIINPIKHDISKCVGNYKRMTSRQIGAWLHANSKTELLEKLRITATLEPTPDSRIWQYRYDCLSITEDKTLRDKIDYIHNNPVKAGLAKNSQDWEYSSARNYLTPESAISGLKVETDFF